MATQNEMSREDKRILYDMTKVLLLDDKHLRSGVEEVVSKIKAGMTKEDIAWVAMQFGSKQ